MELTEPIESINKQLERLFGVDTVSGRPMWRIVWSEEQFEKRLGTFDDYTPEGIYLRTVTEVREVPKYRQWIKERFVLENLVIVPDVNSGDLPMEKVSYEPKWVFETQRGEYLPPRMDASKLIIDTIYAAMGKSTLAKYKDHGENPEEYNARIQKLQEDMFGNETATGDALAHKQAIIVPRNYEKVN